MTSSGRYRDYFDSDDSDDSEDAEYFNARQSPPRTASSIPCRFYRMGTCKFGDDCRFGHFDSDSTQDTDTEDNFSVTESSTSSAPVPCCHYFRWGTCKFGDNCHFSHEQTSMEKAETRRDDEPVASSSCGSGNSSDIFGSLCPYIEASQRCETPDCRYSHGSICDICGKAALHPFKKELSQIHIDKCIKEHVEAIERSSAVQRSRDKSCGICFEIVMEKYTSREQRFGILPNCNHCFCMSCISKWRQAKDFDDRPIRSCPACRVTSDFVFPSTYWIESYEEKKKFIAEHKKTLSQKPCWRFRKGGRCRFGDDCFYLHVQAPMT